MAAKNLKEIGPDYRPYYLGRGRISPDALIKINAQSNRIDFYLGHLFDKNVPERKFDFYLSLRRDEKGKIRTDRLIVVK